MADALYGAGGFYRRADIPAQHFRTSAHAPVFAEALLMLVRRCGVSRMVDVGAGGGELLAELHRLDPDLSLHGVDVAGRPHGLPDAIGWSAGPPILVDALVLANEWLDNVPVDVVQSTVDGPRVVLVDDDGVETLGGRPTVADLEWLAAWWPLVSVAAVEIGRRSEVGRTRAEVGRTRAEIGRRAEVGRTRDAAWAGLVRAARRCVLVAVDYAHSAANRPARGSLTGYCTGRQVRPVPDGTCDITAHVALDACAAAGVAASATGSWFGTQRAVLLDLAIGIGIDIDFNMGAGSPTTSQASPTGSGCVGWRDGMTSLRALARRGEVAELVDPCGLGGFGWLIQSVGRPLPRLPGPRRASVPGDS